MHTLCCLVLQVGGQQRCVGQLLQPDAGGECGFQTTISRVGVPSAPRTCTPASVLPQGSARTCCQLCLCSTPVLQNNNNNNNDNNNKNVRGCLDGRDRPHAEGRREACRGSGRALCDVCSANSIGPSSPCRTTTTTTTRTITTTTRTTTTTTRTTTTITTTRTTRCGRGLGSRLDPPPPSGWESYHPLQWQAKKLWVIHIQLLLATPLMQKAMQRRQECAAAHPNLPASRDQGRRASPSYEWTQAPVLAYQLPVGLAV